MIPDLRDTIYEAWRTNDRLTVYLVEHLPQRLWVAAVPGAPRRTVCMIAGHLHNVRCRWIKTLGQEFGIAGTRADKGDVTIGRRVRTGGDRSLHGAFACFVGGWSESAVDERFPEPAMYRWDCW